MKILAGLASEEQIEMGGTEGLFESPEGIFYNYQFEVVDEGNGNGYVRISDSVGRMVPMDFDEIEDLAEMFARITRFAVAKRHVEDNLLKDLMTKNTWLADELDEVAGI